MKKIMTVVFAVIATSVFSQEQGKFRISFNTNIPITIIDQLFGLHYEQNNLFDLKFGYNLQDNMNIGVRSGILFAPKPIDNRGQHYGYKVSGGTANTIGTFTYYFNSENSFVPFVGGGLGLYYIFVRGYNAYEMKNETKFGGMLITGYEWGRFRLGLEYNLMPKSAIKVFNNSGEEYSTRSMTNSYFGISVGFYIGGGKWGRQSNQNSRRR